MKCCYCGSLLDKRSFCPGCGSDVSVWKKTCAISNRLYNDGLDRARIRDLTGAAESLSMSLRYNKMNKDARNLLGLIYFETGEFVRALGEWVISKSLCPDDNPAVGYLESIQENSAALNALDNAVKKYNQALTSSRQGSYDIAAIQLKSVISQYPGFVKARQLLALLYMREGNYMDAYETLKLARRTDSGNVLTMRYLKECRDHLKAEKKSTRRRREAVSYQSGNEMIIRPARVVDNTAVLSVINILVGAAIGIAVVCFLVVPGVRQSASSKAASSIAEINETLTLREQTIESLEEEIESLNSQVSSANETSDSVQSQLSAAETLMEAYVSAASGDTDTAASLLAEVDESLLSDNAKELYADVYVTAKQEELAELLESGISAYDSEEYEEAVSYLSQIVSIDESYNEGEAVYYLAYSYYQLGDNENAVKYFEISVNYLESSSRKSTASNFVKKLQ